MAASALIEVHATDPLAPVRAVNQMRAAGFTLSVRNDRLIVTPADRLTDQQCAYLRANKAALIDLLTDATPATPPPEPAPDVRCSDCRHGQPAKPSDPWSWHLCAAGAIRAHGWGMAARRCGRWEGKS